MMGLSVGVLSRGWWVLMWGFARVSRVVFSGAFWWVLGITRLADCLWRFVGGSGWLVECSESVGWLVHPKVCVCVGWVRCMFCVAILVGSSRAFVLCVVWVGGGRVGCGWWAVWCSMVSWLCWKDMIEQWWEVIGCGRLEVSVFSLCMLCMQVCLLYFPCVCCCRGFS